MALEQYYLAESAFAYPSSNANDGGEDNSEANLKMITDKFAIKSFVVYRTDKKDTYFLISYYSNSPQVGIQVTEGECSINGYYFNLDDMTLITNKSDQTSQLISTKKYNVALRLYKDGTGHLRGDGTAVVEPHLGQLENRGIVLGLYTDEELAELDEDLILVLGDFTTDVNGNPPTNPEDYHLNEFRFVFLHIDMITTDSGMKLEDWVIYMLDHLNKLQYWEGDELISSLVLNDKDVIITLPDRDPISITAIEDRTHVAESGQFTATIENVQNPYDYSVNTYNGTSILLARSDHNHDDKYILKHCNPDTWGSTPIIQRLVNSGLAMSGNLVVGPNSNISSTANLTNTGKFEVNATDGSFKAANGNLTVNNSGNINSKGYLILGTASESGAQVGDIKNSGNITATGDITGNRVFNAVWNDYADAVPKKKDTIYSPDPGDIICKCSDSNEYELSCKSNAKLVVGVYSDTYGHLLGGDPNKSLEENLENYIPIAVAGNVKVKVVGKVKAGDLVVPSNIRGVGKSQKLFTKGKVVGKALENKTSNDIGIILIQVMLR